MFATAPQIARATLGRATPLTRPNAQSQARYGPGVARPRPQSKKRSTYMRASNTPKGIVGLLCTQKVLATEAPANRQHAQLSGARHRPLAHPNALSRALDGPGVARPRTQPQKRHARVPSTRRDASRDPFALKSCVLEICGTSKLLAERPISRPSKSIILSVSARAKA